MNDTINIAKPRSPQITIKGGYCEIRNPARRANAIKNTNKILDRTIISGYHKE